MKLTAQDVAQVQKLLKAKRTRARTKGSASLTEAELEKILRVLEGLYAG